VTHYHLRGFSLLTPFRFTSCHVAQGSEGSSTPIFPGIFSCNLLFNSFASTSNFPHHKAFYLKFSSISPRPPFTYLTTYFYHTTFPAHFRRILVESVRNITNNQLLYFLTSVTGLSPTFIFYTSLSSAPSLSHLNPLSRTYSTSALLERPPSITTSSEEKRKESFTTRSQLTLSSYPYSSPLLSIITFKNLLQY